MAKPREYLCGFVLRERDAIEGAISGQLLHLLRLVSGRVNLHLDISGHIGAHGLELRLFGVKLCLELHADFAFL